MVEISEVIGGNEYILASTPIVQSQLPSQTKITFSPTSSEVKVKFKYGTSGWTWHGHSICITKPVMVSETYYVDVCDGGEDKYRFGFNGMEKDNEVKGVGNSLDFGARMYDARLGRWMSVDPKFRLQPGQSTYKAFLNNSIIYNDPEGETEFYYNGKWIGTDGKDNNLIAVVTNNKLRKEIESQTKLGHNQPEQSTNRGADSREGMFLINRDVLQTSYEVLELSLGEKGKVGEYSVSMDRNGNNFSKIDNIQYKVGTTTQGIPEGDVSIHSHPTGIDENGGYGRADDPSIGEANDIPGLFRNFDVNIIVGKGGEDVYKDNNNYLDKREEQINIYDKNPEPKGKNTSKIGSLDKRETKKILNNDRGKLGETYDKKSKSNNEK